MAFIWFFIGAVVVSAVYFLSGDSLSPWPALEAATIAACVYFLAVVTYATRKPFPRRTRIYAIVVCVLVVIAAGSFSMKFEETTTWQRGQLLKILGVSHKGMINAQLPDPLMATLDRYHRQPAKRKTLGQIFGEVMPGAAVGKNIYNSYDERDSLRIFVATLSDDEVELIGQSTWAKGKDPEFRNYDGKRGMVQERAVLTAKGVTYESEN